MLEQGFEIPLQISWIYATKFVTLWLFCEKELAKRVCTLNQNKPQEIDVLPLVKKQDNYTFLTSGPIKKVIPTMAVPTI
ncbi:MAG: hypothetical protein IIT55_11050, partial [Bacteroidaceae bacterium]|nr:hypothetical protein [Bacteroidaceae bacterium]